MQTISVITLITGFLPLIYAHTRFTTLYVNGQSQGDGTCIRMDMDPSTTTSFVIDPLSEDNSNMVCGHGGIEPIFRTCLVNAGDTVSLQHRAWADGAQPGSIDPSHKGSTAIYMKKVGNLGDSDPFSAPAAGAGLFKIHFDGYDDSAAQWGTEKMIANDGLVTTTVPHDLAGGYYLIRSEILSLQNIVNEHINPQFYVGCAQIYVNGTGSATPSATVAIPGHIDDSTPAISYNIYHETPPAQPFAEFGPPVYNNSDPNVDLGATFDTSAQFTLSLSDIVGTCPESTILQVANQCLTELPSWSNDTPGSLPKCWNASQTCWNTLDECWKNTGPAVNKADTSIGCHLWNDKCLRLVDWCNQGNLEGPPERGTALTSGASRKRSQPRRKRK